MQRLGLVAVFALALAWPGDGRAADADLLGTWHVLMHYTDTATQNPDFERWLDEIWVIEPSGDRIKWTRYPIVVFNDKTGRFERTSRQFSRQMHYWEPNDAQLDQIRSGGLEINERGSKSKTLRGSDQRGWKSRVNTGGGFSANTLTYTETWTIDPGASGPVFRFQESLGGARAETLDGVTLYETEAIETGGDFLRGRFNRDGTREGHFQMRRAAAVSEVTGSSSQAEMRTRASSSVAGESAAEGLADMLSQEGFEQKDLKQIYMGRVLQAGGDPRQVDSEIDAMVAAIFAAKASGKTPQEIEDGVRRGEIRP